MEEYITKQTAFDIILRAKDKSEMKRMIIQTMPESDIVPRGAYDQVVWERNIAIEQLQQLGYEFGEKVTPVVRCKDCKFSDWYTAMDGNRYCYCTEHGSSGHKENDYCSYGERDGDS